MPARKPVLPALPFAEAVDFFRGKGKKLDPTFAWQDYRHEDHFTGFTVAKSTGFDILKDIRDGFAESLANGTTEKDFQRQIIPILQAKGWWGRQEMVDPLTGETKMVQLGSLRRLHVIFDTNLRTANAAGRWAQIARSADLAPYLRYSAVLDSRTRPLHRAWNGTILRWDDPWWNTHFPPNGWFCRCTVTQMSDLDLTRFGLTVSTAPPADPTPPRLYVNPRTGEVTEVPAGIDPGFAYNPGRPPAAPPPAMPPSGETLDYHSQNLTGTLGGPLFTPPLPATPASIDGILERAVRTAVSKWVDAPADITAAAAADSLPRLLPELTKDFGIWEDGLATQLKAAEDAAKAGEKLPIQLTGDQRVVGALTQPVLDFLATKSVVPQSGAITITDEIVIHMLRTIKAARGASLPEEDLARLPELLANPSKIYWDTEDPALLYVYDSGSALGKVVVRVDFANKVSRKTVRSNAVRSGGLIDAGDLQAKLRDGRLRYREIEGS